MMNSEVLYRFSVRAREAIGKQAIKDFPDFDASNVPLPGDLFSFADLPELMFSVEHRGFHWISGKGLQIHICLDLYTDQDY